jgi:TRAP-type uncharacterized transport system fused permease subunit
VRQRASPSSVTSFIRVRSSAGWLLAAGGLGAIISPPVLGAAAFLIAEFLKISYLDVITMAAIPTILYYFSILTMVKLDAAKYGGGGELLVQKGTLWRVTREYWFHFGSLVSIIALMLLGFSPVLAVFWATLLAIAVSYLRRDTALVPSNRAGPHQARGAGAHMFIFCYAVPSEVSPPTALSPLLPRPSPVEARTAPPCRLLKYTWKRWSASPSRLRLPGPPIAQEYGA